MSYSLPRETSSDVYSDVYSHGNGKKRKENRTGSWPVLESTGIVYSHSADAMRLQRDPCVSAGSSE